MTGPSGVMASIKALLAGGPYRYSRLPSSGSSVPKRQSRTVLKTILVAMSLTVAVFLTVAFS